MSEKILNHTLKCGEITIQKMYNEQELDGLIDLLKGYSKEEIERLNLTEPM